MSKAVTKAPPHNRHSGPSEREQLAEGERLLSRINAGERPSDLMAEFGVSKATLYRRIRRAIEARVAPTVDEYRAQQNARLDDLTREWHRQLDTGNALVEQGMTTESVGLVERGLKVRADALAGMLRVDERRARLMGTDAPVRVDATVHDVTPNIDNRVAEMAAQIRERAAAEARSA